MQKAYYMRLNIGDLHSSPAWRIMKPIQRGAYIELFTLCFGAGGKLPNDPEQLRLMSGMTLKEWRKYGGLVLAQFEPHTDGDGTLTQSRVVKELIAIAEKGDKARASASARWAQPPDANAYRTQSEGNARQKTEDNRQKTDIIPPTPKGALDYSLPLDLMADARLVEAWGRWNTHLAEKKVRRTQSAINGQINKLRQLGTIAVSTIDNSIAGNYQGLWEPKQQSGGNSQSIPQQTSRVPRQAPPLQ
jgi:uncharacterized protein YdaU (DUF1376 family)